MGLEPTLLSLALPRGRLWAHQSVLEAAIRGAQQDAASQAQVPVEPGVPEAAPIRLNVQHHKAALLPFTHGLQLQTGAAGQHTQG